MSQDMAVTRFTYRSNPPESKSSHHHVTCEIPSATLESAIVRSTSGPVIFTLPPVSDVECSEMHDVPVVQDWTLSDDSNWLVDPIGRKVRWIHEVYRPSHSDHSRGSLTHYSEGKFIIGCASGRVVMFDVSRVRPE